MEESSQNFWESSNLNGEEEIGNNISTSSSNKDHGWQKVTYAKRQRKPTSTNGGSDPVFNSRVNGGGGGGTNKSNVFKSVEKDAEDRRKRVVEAQKAAAAAEGDGLTVTRSKHHSDDDYDSDVEVSGGGVENGNTEEKKPKIKKPKKPKVTVPDAASKIDSSDLSAFLIDVSASYESQEDIQLMRFADYFARAFSAVNASQFPWMKMFKESTVAKIADIPLCYISEDVYKTSVDWIYHISSEALGNFVLWSLDSILADLAHQQGTVKGSKKVAPQVSSKGQLPMSVIEIVEEKYKCVKEQSILGGSVSSVEIIYFFSQSILVAIFVVLAMTLRRKPDVLTSILPKLRENPKYQGQDKLPVIVWMISQACHGDLAVGMYSWVYNLLPIVNGKSCNPQSRDLILQSVERILSSPKARPVLLNGAVRKGERLVPPSALELLMRATFPASSARVKATERFEAVYPVLKEVALAGVPGSKAMKQVSQQIFSFALKAAGENIPELSKEATTICLWCLTQNPDNYKQWEKVYVENIEASVAVLKKLSNEWKEHSAKHGSLDPLREAVKSFRQKNEKELDDGEKASRQAIVREADKYCKVISGRLSRGNVCLKSMVFAVVAVAVGAYVINPDLESWDLKKLTDKLVVMINSPGSL